jgi:UDP-N-acetyl-D-mannosaminuronic acid dehydrogenase
LSEPIVAVVGLGRVGLPLSLVLAATGCEVRGIDINTEMLSSLAEGRMPFFENDADALLAAELGKRFRAGNDMAAAEGCDYVVLTLGTPVDNNMDPDLSQIESSIQELAPHLAKGQTVILRSTVNPGTTEWVQAKLEDEFGYRVGEDIFLAFCPERIAEGRALKELHEIPQIVGGIDSASTEKALALFKRLGVECHETDALSAELAKLFTNMFRYISFAIANEFMILAGQWHRDINHIVDLVNTGYPRGGLARPGLTAGPCLFKDGFFLINQLPFTELISTAWKINESVPLFMVSAVKAEIELRNASAAILGAAFKADSDDDRQSLSYKVAKALRRERARVRIHDPYVPGLETDLEDVVRDTDVVFVAINHRQYKEIGLKRLQEMVKPGCLICDIWNVFGTDHTIFRAGNPDPSTSHRPRIAMGRVPD